MNTKRLVTNSALAAMCAVLGGFALDFGNLKITLESLPVLVGALLFGPLDGMAVGLVGTLISQLLRYGITATTLLWIVPYVACGLAAGLWARHYKFRLSRGKAILIIIAAELIVTTLNTGALYIDSHIYGYYTPSLILAMLIPRYAICVGKSIVIGAVMPELLRMLRRVRKSAPEEN